MPATRTRAASPADIAAAIAALSPPKDDSLSKTVISGICAMLGAIILALIFWFGSSVNDLGTKVTAMSTNLDNVQKSIADLQQGQGANSKTTSDLQAQVAAGAARSTAIEQDILRMKERIRIVEKQPPLGS